MKKLREGFTTGSCAAAASLASVLWHINGKCPDAVEITTPIGRVFRTDIIPVENGKCGVIKDGGDDPDETNGCMVCADVIIGDSEGDIVFHAGEGVGTITKKGLKLDVGEPAINPVPRQMIEKELRSVIGSKRAEVTISVPDGIKIAERTFNGRLGIVGGISILGTTGIVRPMSEEAIKDSLRLELSMCYETYGKVCAFVSGYSGEKYLKERFCDNGPAVLCSNYLGYLLDCAEEMGFEKILLAGGCGKFIKPAADIMYLHSHTAGGQREIICTHAALLGADTDKIKQLYEASLTKHALELLDTFGIKADVLSSIAESAVSNCMKRVHGKIEVGMILIDENRNTLVQTKNCDNILREWRR